MTKYLQYFRKPLCLKLMNIFGKLAITTMYEKLSCFVRSKTLKEAYLDHNIASSLKILASTSAINKILKCKHCCQMRKIIIPFYLISQNDHFIKRPIRIESNRA